MIEGHVMNVGLTENDRAHLRRAPGLEEKKRDLYQHAYLLGRNDRCDAHDGPQPNYEAEAKALRKERDACERYAGRLETALEHIKITCRMAIAAQDGRDVEALDLIAYLSIVKDERGSREIPF